MRQYDACSALTCLKTTKIVDVSFYGRSEFSCKVVKIIYSHPMSKISASHILVEHEHEVKDVIAKLKEGKSFEELAMEHSTCPSGKRGGALGEFAKGMMVKPFEDAAFALEVGAVSGVVKTQFGHHLIKRTK